MPLKNFSSIIHDLNIVVTKKFPRAGILGEKERKKIQNEEYLCKKLYGWPGFEKGRRKGKITLVSSGDLWHNKNTVNLSGVRAQA